MRTSITSMPYSRRVVSWALEVIFFWIASRPISMR